MHRTTMVMAVAAAMVAGGGLTVRAAGPLMTEWGEKVTAENAWREYPRPQLVRGNWTCLNGHWDYAVTPKAAETAGFPTKWDGRILVPFAIESALSGVGRRLEPSEFLWYRRMVNVVRRAGERTILRFDGVDFRAQVFLNGVEVSDVPHEGGQVPFSYDITDFAKDGANELVVCVWDPTTEFVGAAGKQWLRPGGCFYTRVSGIWQSVWMEQVPDDHIVGYKAVADVAKGEVKLEVEVANRSGSAQKLTVSAFDGDRKIGDFAPVSANVQSLRLASFECWSPEKPKLYTFTAKYGQDEVRGYFAMRTIEKRRDANNVWRFYLNGEPCFLQGPLDQGWWPDGLLTPPSEEAMAFDIRTLKELGFNMMRKHIKVEPSRYYWLCDTMGLMVLQDMPSGAGEKNTRYGFYRRELKEMVDALGVFPCIVMWVPYNESWGQPGKFLTNSTFNWLKRYDPHHLIDGPSGWNDYGCTAADAIDCHCYRGPSMHALNAHRVSFLGEFGGLGHPVKGHMWRDDGKANWGYGGTGDTATREGLQNAYLGLMRKLAILARNGLGGSVYTQTTDVEIESNGYMTYDRKVFKFDKAALRKAHQEVTAAADFAARNKIVRRELFPRRSEWAYTFGRPADGWKEAGFDDAAWARGKGGFGHAVNAGSCGVEWKTPEIWLRRSFALEKTDDIRAAVMDLFHDEDAEVYVNGVKVLSVTGYSQRYELTDLDRKAFLSAVRPGKNVIAVHVRQTAGGQYFDAALFTF